MTVVPLPPVAAAKAILSCMEGAAERGEICPTNDALATLIGAASIATASRHVKELEQRGLIRVERGSRSRVVTIVATGKSTADAAGASGSRAEPDPGPTGAELADAIRRRAHELGIAVTIFARPLSPHPQTWLSQLERARRPQPHTLARIEALLAGNPVSAPPANNFQANAGVDRREALQRAATDEASRAVDRRVQAARLTTRHPLEQALAGTSADDPGEAPLPPVTTRDPCPRCGVRADIGCSHRPAAPPAAGAEARDRTIFLPTRLHESLRLAAIGRGRASATDLAVELLTALLADGLVDAILDPEFRRELAA